jgi:hypothetical protein
MLLIEDRAIASPSLEKERAAGRDAEDPPNDEEHGCDASSVISPASDDDPS